MTGFWSWIIGEAATVVKESASEAFEETAFESVADVYFRVVKKFAKKYLKKKTPPVLLMRFRKRFTRILRITVLIIDQIDSLCTKREHQRWAAVSDVMDNRDHKYLGFEEEVIEVKRKKK